MSRRHLSRPASSTQGAARPIALPGSESWSTVADMATAARPRTNGAMNTLLARDAPAHDWYRFVLSFPPHLVRDYAQRFGLDADSRVLDPFCGTGTTLVEAKKLGVPSCGLEAVPLSRLAASTKVDWTPDPDELLKHAELVAEKALAMLAADGISDEPASSVPRECGCGRFLAPVRSCCSRTQSALCRFTRCWCCVTPSTANTTRPLLTTSGSHWLGSCRWRSAICASGQRWASEPSSSMLRWCLRGLSAYERCAPICTNSGRAPPLRLSPSTRTPDWSANSLSPAASMRSSPRRRTRTRRTTRAPCAWNRCFWAISAAGRIFRR